MSAVVTKLKRDRITIGLLRFISEAYVNKREENNAVQRGLESVRHMVIPQGYVSGGRVWLSR